MVLRTSFCQLGKAVEVFSTPVLVVAAHTVKPALRTGVGVENILPLYVTVEAAWSCARSVNETPYARARMFVRLLFLHSALKALSNPSLFFAFLAVLLLVVT